MALLALTQNNVDFIKRGLKPSYPSIKSSHLSEAIAAACGFRTNIALVTSIRAADTRRPDLAEVDPGRFIARLAELGYPALGATGLPGVVRSQEMPDRIWFVRKGRDIPAVNVWYRECQRRDIPYIYITNQRKLAQIDWDYFALDPRHDYSLGKGNPNLGREMFKEFQRITKDMPGKPFFDGFGMVGSIKKVPIERAPELADMIFKMQYEAIREGEGQAA